MPLLPEYVESFSEDEVVFRNFRGERYVYRQPRGVGTAGPRKFVSDPEYLLESLDAIPK